MSPWPSSRPDDSALRAHQRLQRWRHRERRRRPGLFASSLIPSVPPPPVILQRLHCGRCKLLISGSAIFLCGGCGALLVSPDTDHAASSASTLPPAGAPNDYWVACESCSFVTPVGTLRRLLDLPNDRGPALVAEIAQALLVEALGAPSSCELQDRFLREWVLDTNCRMAGLDALCGTLGLRDEQLNPVAVTAEKDKTLAMIEAERFLERTVPKNFMPPIPFSVSQLRAGPLNEDTTTCAGEAREAAERAKALVIEAVRVWQQAMGEEISGDETSAAAILKIRALGREYLVERTRARSYNLSQLHVPQKIQVTQPQQLSHASGGNILARTDGA